MDTSAATELAATLQSASINPSPSVAHDANPSTAASAKIPVLVSRPSHLSSPPSSPSQIPISARPLPPRRAGPQMPPLPDLRFEQSYLASLPAEASHARIAYITIRDHVVAPLLQGFGWSVLLLGWRHWNRGSQFLGQSVGARLRRWWWRVNHWDVSDKTTQGKVQEYYTSQLGAGGD